MRSRLGNRVTVLLYQRRMTDEMLAVRAGVSRAQVNRIRNGRAIPRVKTAIALAAALGCRVREVFYLKR
jgi:DNA-binding XRE family transcriptional regulator